eukprot:1187949-Prorocentrum_minimum.AAC.1
MPHNPPVLVLVYPADLPAPLPVPERDEQLRGHHGGLLLPRPAHASGGDHHGRAGGERGGACHNMGVSQPGCFMPIQA